MAVIVKLLTLAHRVRIMLPCVFPRRDCAGKINLNLKSNSFLDLFIVLADLD